ncbi:MAG TPA: HAD family phosphatase [Phycisphaerae bacterium]|nr:HAD family phosphatase [Phycisphaerae bacterium]
MLRAIIFDCDGVIADTEPLHYRAFCRVLEGVVPVPTEQAYFQKYVGLTDAAYVKTLFEEAGRPLEPERLGELVLAKKGLYREMIEGELPLLPGVEEFIRRAAGRWALGICSGALREEIEFLLRPRGLLPLFSVIVSAESVPTSKPDPTGFKLACRLLAEKSPGLQPNECLAVEDSRHGVTAAKAAGMKVLAVGAMAQSWRPSSADATVADLTRVDDQMLAALFL